MQRTAKEGIVLIQRQYKRAVSEVIDLVDTDISEIRSYNRPPPLVTHVMEAVSLILGFPATWDSAVLLLNDSEVPIMQRVKEFDVASLKPFRVMELKNYVRNENMDIARVGIVSQAAQSFARWAHAVAENSSIAFIKQEKHQKISSLVRQTDVNQVPPSILPLVPAFS